MKNAMKVIAIASISMIHGSASAATNVHCSVHNGNEVRCAKDNVGKATVVVRSRTGGDVTYTADVYESVCGLSGSRYRHYTDQKVSRDHAETYVLRASDKCIEMFIVGCRSDGHHLNCWNSLNVTATQKD